jgi:hypothetical protein
MKETDVKTGPEHLCPRRRESHLQWPGPDMWHGGQCCSYCGSLNPDVFMARLEAGTIELGPTDKNYKVYVENRGGEPFATVHRQCPPGQHCDGPDVCDHWVREERGHAKFYFEHLSEEQRRRFIELLNERKPVIGYPGHFYVLPFFCRRDPKPTVTA